jgi:hypothetical protein
VRSSNPRLRSEQTTYLFNQISWNVLSMLTRERIQQLLEKLNGLLAERGELGEIGLVGGAVMCLVYNARVATKDVDAVFEPASIIRELAARIAASESIPPDWLNDAAKGFILPGFERQEVLNLSNLRVWAPEPRYMLAMKCISARWDTSDRDDVIFLIRVLKLTDPQRVLEIIESYYPHERIPPKTQFLIEELLTKE